jgi:hypothetical protein
VAVGARSLAKTPADKTSGAAGDTPVASPSFRDAAQASADARAAELEAQAQAASSPKTAPSDAAPAVADEEDYSAWYDKLPEKHRATFAQNVMNHQAQQLAEYYGPEVSALLVEIREDPELRKLAAKMSDKQFRSFVKDTAAPIYEDPRFAAPSGADGTFSEDPKVKELAERLDKTEARVDQERKEREYSSYRSQRETEYQALFNTYPELRFDKMDDPKAKFVAAAIERAEERSQKSGRVVTYAETVKELREMTDWQRENPPPRAIPSVSKTEIDRPQAPRTKVDTKNAIARDLQKFGSLSQLASALRK